jgi:hypothetical protein
VPCQYCRGEYPHGELPAHHAKCKPALTAKRALARGLGANHTPSSSSNGGGGSGGLAAIRAPALSSQGSGRSIVAAAADGSSSGGASGSSGALAAGLAVECVGLQAKPEMNGQRGVLLGPDESRSGSGPPSGRWLVRLTDGRGPFNLKPENLRVLGSVGGGGSSISSVSGGGKSLHGAAGNGDGGVGGASRGRSAGGGMGGGGMGGAAAAAADGGGGGFGGLMACAVCGRGFAMDRVATHQRICSKLAEKNQARPRRVFDRKKGRVRRYQ